MLFLYVDYSMRDIRSRKMTIKEIAKLAGVSNAAVSRYLNQGYISSEKKERIKKVIQETGYQPSVHARTLRSKRACLVGVVVPKINSESISRVTEGVGQVLSKRGYQMLLASTDNQAEKEVMYMKIFENYPVDGIILIGTMITPQHRKFLKESRVPVVVIGQYTKLANCIYHDDYGAGKAMGKAVGQSLQRHPAGAKAAYIGVTRDDKSAGAAREDGFRAGLKSEGAELPETYRRISKFRMESGYEAAMDLLKENDDIVIISCATDTIAAGAIEAVFDWKKARGSDQEETVGARKRGILGSSPIKVTGFGDNQFLKAVTGGIPTVHFAYKTSGIKGAELLLDVVENGERIPVEMKLGFRFVQAPEWGTEESSDSSQAGGTSKKS